MKLLVFLAAFLATETALAFLFQFTARKFYRKIGLDLRSIVKGVVERIFLLVALANEYPHAITFFSAVKLATRLKHEEEKGAENKFNDYYLVGNLVSVMVGMGYAHLWAHYDAALSSLGF